MNSRERGAMERETPAEGLRFWQHGAIFLLACLILISRRPDAIFHLQPYAEDGHVWYADAYNLGWWAALFHTWTGYFLTLPRLAAALSLIAPFRFFPLILNLAAISVQALPVNLLVSPRSSGWGDLRLRGLLAAAYLALPNCTELSNGITDANFPLALSAFLLIVARVPRCTSGRLFDFCITLLCGLSGPFCIFLLPISIYLAWKERESWRWVIAGVVGASCAVQSFALLFLAPTARAHRAFGASPTLFGRILGGQVYLATILGSNGLSARSGTTVSVILGCIALCGTVLVTWCLMRAPMVMKIFLLYASMLFISSLIKPVEWGRPDTPVWWVLAGSPGHRYWFFPTLAFAWCLIWCFRGQSPLPKFVSTFLLVLMCFGVVHDWRHPAFRDVNFPASVKRFEAAPPGAVVVIPECPDGWEMKLVKRSAGQ
jgi:hypothetical protein